MRIINALPGGTDPTDAQILEAVETYKGPWPLKRADIDCTLKTVLVPALPGDCSTIFDVFHYSNGVWQELEPVNVES